MPIRTYSVQGTEMRLCPEHAEQLKDSAEELGRELGAKWTCRICTATRRMTEKPLQATVVAINGHIVTRTPVGATYCDCARWRFQRLPPDQRTCQHIQEAYP